MINYNNFILKEVIQEPPISLAYKKFWEEEKNKCINGLWQQGYWMPGNLYFYINHTHILLNLTDHSKSKTVARPFLRDIDWEFFRGWAEARGISGFEKDEKYTCHRLIEKLNKLKLKIEEDPTVDYSGELKLLELEIDSVNKETNNALINPKTGKFKTYIPARDYISRQWPTDMGNPQFYNEAKNFMMLGARGFGKSYSVANGIILHEFTFTPNSEIVVGAGDAKYSTDLLEKVRLAMDNLMGGQYYAGNYYPPPFSKKYKGSWVPGKGIIAQYDIKEGGNWITKGTKSRIKHRSFKDNPFAANGTRPSVMVMEEVGMFNNLEASFNASVECMRNAKNKFGSMMMLGTGGDFEAGGTRDAKEIFYDPNTYDCVAYEDTWEPRVGKICYFVPAYMAQNNYKIKDENSDRCYSRTNIEAAKLYFEQEREKLKKAKSLKRLDDEVQNRPVVPSEMFLVTSGNIFPVQLLKDHKQEVEAKNYLYELSHFGSIDENYKFVKDTSIKPLMDYPIKKTNNNKGCVVIHEFPPKDGNIPYGMYVAGLDPYRFDSSEDSPSVGALYIYKRFTNFEATNDKLVASYVGRPETLADFHETCRRLLKMYNAECLYENEINNFYEFLKMRGEDYMLTDQPDALIREFIQDSKVSRGKGIHMVNKIKNRALYKLRDWLLEVRGHREDGSAIMNLHTIHDIGLLTELISYNDEFNFDRVIAMALTILADDYKYKVKVKKEEQDRKKDPFWDRKLFNKNFRGTVIHTTHKTRW